MRRFMKWFCLIMAISGVITIPIQISQGNGSTEMIIAGICTIALFIFGFIKSSKNPITTKHKDYNTMSEISEKKLENVELKNDSPCNEEYLNTVLEDGKSIKEHMQEDFIDAMERSQGMDEQQEIELNDLERQFIDNFLDYLKLFNLDTEIRYNRMSNKCLNFTYRDMQIGRVKLNGRKMWIQILYKKAPIVECFDISNVDEAITYLDKWIEYINYLIKD